MLNFDWLPEVCPLPCNLSKVFIDLRNGEMTTSHFLTEYWAGSGSIGPVQACLQGMN